MWVNTDKLHSLFLVVFFFHHYPLELTILDFTFTCTYVPEFMSTRYMQCAQEPEESVRSLRGGAAGCELGTELQSSSRAAGTLNC